MARTKKDDTAQPSRSRKTPEKSASTSASRSATRSQTVPAKSRSSAASRTAARSTSGTSRSRSTTQTRSASRSQGSLLNPMAWLSTLETALTSPQARAVMAEALRAVANVLEKPQSSEQGQRGGTQEGRNAVSVAGSLGAEIVAAPLEVAAAAIGAAGEVVTGALGGSSGEDGGSRKGGRRTSSRRK
jgi:hypothetical protein